MLNKQLRHTFVGYFTVSWFRRFRGHVAEDSFFGDMTQFRWVIGSDVSKQHVFIFKGLRGETSTLCLFQNVGNHVMPRRTP